MCEPSLREIPTPVNIFWEPRGEQVDIVGPILDRAHAKAEAVLQGHNNPDEQPVLLSEQPRQVDPLSLQPLQIQAHQLIL